MLPLTWENLELRDGRGDSIVQGPSVCWVWSGQSVYPFEDKPTTVVLDLERLIFRDKKRTVNPDIS